MTWEIAFVVTLLVLALAGFLLEKIPVDQIAFTVFAMLALAGLLPFADKLPDIRELLTVFANPAPMTIAAMFVLSAALERTGVIETIASAMGRFTDLGYRWFLFLLVLAVACISAFINNTPVVMVFLPVVLSISRSLGVPASKLLIPLSYASIFGGTCTLVGTSTNILASSILQDAGERPLGMFEIAWVGLPLVFFGAIYLVFFGARLLPERESLTSILSEEERKEFITEAYIRRDSPIAGKSVAESRLLKKHAVRVLEVVRDEVALRVDPRTTLLHEGDRLVLACRASGIAHARSIEGVDLIDTRGVGLETVSAHEGAIVEGVIGPRSSLADQSLQEINFRQRFRVVLLAIHRRGINLRDKLDRAVLQSGDLVLMMGTDAAVEQLRKSDDILLLDKPYTPSLSMRKKKPIVVATIAGVILAASFHLAPIVAAALVGVAVLFATGCIKPKEGYANIEWSILVLIYGMLGLGLAMQTTGTADLVARGLSAVADVGFLPDPLKPYLVLAMLYLCTMIMTETLSNNATVVLMTPIALSLGMTLGVDPRPFVIATCIAASASFSTPIGYQTNTYVYGAGGYRFADFARVGLPLNLLYFAVSVVLIPRIWAF
ncbi:MAG: SLC13 family permease [bacterium]|nr:SLC13 family permease [bacterium]